MKKKVKKSVILLIDYFYMPPFIFCFFSVCGGYYTAPSYDVIHGVCFVPSVKAEVIWFDTLVSDPKV